MIRERWSRLRSRSRSGLARGRLKRRCRGCLTRRGSRCRHRIFLLGKCDNLVLSTPAIDEVRIHVLTPVAGLLVTIYAPDPHDIAVIQRGGRLGDRGSLGARFVKVEIGFTNELCTRWKRVCKLRLVLHVVHLAVDCGRGHFMVDDEPGVSAIGRVRGDGYIVLKFITINAVLNSIRLDGERPAAVVCCDAIVSGNGVERPRGADETKR